MIELKDFQETPSLELYEKIVNLAKESMFRYGEKELGEFLLNFAHSYHRKTFELQTRLAQIQRAEILTKQSEREEEEEEETSLFKNKKDETIH